MGRRNKSRSPHRHLEAEISRKYNNALNYRERRANLWDQGKVIRGDAMTSEETVPLGPIRALTHPAVLIGASLVLILVVSIWLWHIVWLRPYLAASGAALGAFITPIRSFLSDTRAKWFATITLTTLISVGTWYSTNDVVRRLTTANEDQRSAELKLDRFGAAIQSLVARMTPEGRNAFWIAAGSQFHELFRTTRDFAGLTRLTNTLMHVDPKNGHVLYFSGEAYRLQSEHSFMVDSFVRFDLEAGRRDEAKTGGAADCSQRPSGYCAERAAWVAHLLARYHFDRAKTASGPERRSNLDQAAAYASKSLSFQPRGFDRFNQLQSSCEFIRSIVNEMKLAGVVSESVRALPKKLDGQCELHLD